MDEVDRRARGCGGLIMRILADLSLKKIKISQVRLVAFRNRHIRQLTTVPLGLIYLRESSDKHVSCQKGELKALPL